MKCPKCKSELVFGKREIYETLVEHVSNPNDENLPLRWTYVCPNKCYDGFYDDYGAYYSYTYDKDAPMDALDNTEERK
jgi:hypothetical protein